MRALMTTLAALALTCLAACGDEKRGDRMVVGFSQTEEDGPWRLEGLHAHRSPLLAVGQRVAHQVGEHLPRNY